MYGAGATLLRTSSKVGLPGDNRPSLRAILMGRALDGSSFDILNLSWTSKETLEAFRGGDGSGVYGQTVAVDLR